MCSAKIVRPAAGLPAKVGIRALSTCSLLVGLQAPQDQHSRHLGVQLLVTRGA